MNGRDKTLRSVLGQPWAMHPRRLAAIYLHALNGQDDASPYGDDSMAPETEESGSVLVIPIRGTIVHHWTDGFFSFGLVTPTEWLIEALDRAESDDTVSAVVLDIDSGGGMAAGTPEAAERIFKFRDSKPIVAVANSFAASAAYYLGAAASTFYVIPSGEVGSIGTLMIHQDVTKMLEDFGVKVEILRATEAENKARFNPFEPLSDEEREHVTEQLDTINARFLADVERFRGMEPGTVAKLSGNGRTFLAAAAVDAGLVDGVRTLGEVLAELTAGVEARSADGLEVRGLEAPARSEGERLEGTSVRFGSLSEDLGGFREQFAPDAFEGSVGTDDVVVAWQHDPGCVFGRTSAGTAEVTVDAEGLHYSATPPDAQWARDAMESIRRGDVKQNSFAFAVREPRDQNQKWERRDGQLVRTVLKARLYETGPQTFPAYTDTSVAVRSMNDALSAGRVVDVVTGTPALNLRKLRKQVLDAA